MPKSVAPFWTDKKSLKIETISNPTRFHVFFFPFLHSAFSYRISHFRLWPPNSFRPPGLWMKAVYMLGFLVWRLRG